MTDTTRVLTRLARAVARSTVDGPLPLRLCVACVSILGVQGGSITVAYNDPQRVTLCATDEVAEQIEDLHEVVGEGPNYAAYERAQMVSVQVDGVADQRWPLFAEAVKRRIGSCSIYAVPIVPGVQSMGVASFWQKEPAPLLVDDATCQLLINAVGVALVKDPDLVDEDPQASSSWGNRSKISQATGMVMAQLGMAPDDALALLRAHAYAHNTSLSHISDDVIARRLDFITTD